MAIEHDIVMSILNGRVDDSLPLPVLAARCVILFPSAGK